MDFDKSDVAVDDLTSHSDDLLILADPSFAIHSQHETPMFQTANTDLNAAIGTSQSIIRENHASGQSTLGTNLFAQNRFFEPTDTDVLLGRGRKFREHPANIRLRDLVSQFRSEYDSSSRDGKTEISKQIVKMMKTDIHKPARFLKLNKPIALWVEVDDEIARLKVSHVFRDGKRIKASSDKNLSQLFAARDGKPHFPQQDGQYKQNSVEDSQDHLTNFNAPLFGLEHAVAVLHQNQVRQQMRAFSSITGNIAQPFDGRAHHFEGTATGEQTWTSTFDHRNTHDSTVVLQPNILRQQQDVAFNSSAPGTNLNSNQATFLSPFYEAQNALPSVLYNSSNFQSIGLQHIAMNQQATSRVETMSTPSELFSSSQWGFPTPTDSMDTGCMIQSYSGGGFVDLQQSAVWNDLDEQSSDFEQHLLRR